MQSTALTGLMQIDLPAATVRLCDGGMVRWGSDTFTAKDPLYGTIGAAEALTEGVGDEVPAMQFRMYPPAASAVSDLAVPGYQTSRVRLWIATFNPATGAVVGTPDLMFDGQLDQIVPSGDRTTREVGITVVSAAERLFNRSDGNSLSPTFHKSLWPGETGHDDASGLTVPVAWGVEAPVTGYSGGNVVGWATQRLFGSDRGAYA